MHEAGCVQFEGVADFAEEVEDIGEGQSLVGGDLLVVQVEQPSQLQVGAVLSLVDLEVDQVQGRTDVDVGDGVAQQVGVGPLLLLGQHHCHDLPDLEGTGGHPGHPVDVDVGEVGVVLVEGGVGLEEGVVLGDGQGHRLV